MTAIVFNPPDHVVGRILDDVCNPSLSLEDVAQAHEVTLDAFVLWISRPDIQDRLALIATSAALRVRTIATLNLTSAVHCVSSIIKGYQHREHNATRETPEALAALETLRLNARRAASLLLRLARFQFELAPRRAAAPAPGTGPSPGWGRAPAPEPPGSAQAPLTPPSLAPHNLPVLTDAQPQEAVALSREGHSPAFPPPVSPSRATPRPASEITGTRYPARDFSRHLAPSEHARAHANPAIQPASTSDG